MGYGCMQYVDAWRPLGMGCKCSDCMETPVYDQVQMWRMHGDPWVWGVDACSMWMHGARDPWVWGVNAWRPLCMARCRCGGCMETRVFLLHHIARQPHDNALPVYQGKIDRCIRNYN